MFDLSWSHILIVLVVALVVVGPKDLPRLMRTAGAWMAKARNMANEFRRSFDEMARQSELDELRAEIEALRGQRPFSGIENDLHQSILPTDDAPPAAPDAGKVMTGAPHEPADAPGGGAAPAPAGEAKAS
ncbi:MAG TPA: Sec-independent protein translocase protein TatB [Rhizomicrobium sp.]|nr:Sec-independent protein translocase protein TatB [Rhizomicrobium sp.]